MTRDENENVCDNDGGYSEYVCEYCGKVIDGYVDRVHDDDYYFCNVDHMEEFYNDKFRDNDKDID